VASLDGQLDATPLPADALQPKPQNTAPGAPDLEPAATPPAAR
jgi:hypothetical protein